MLARVLARMGDERGARGYQSWVEGKVNGETDILERFLKGKSAGEIRDFEIRAEKKIKQADSCSQELVVCV